MKVLVYAMQSTVIAYLDRLLLVMPHVIMAMYLHVS